MHKKLVFFFLTVFLFLNKGFAQEMVEKSVMRSEGKVYVVLAVCLTILIGLIGYLVRIDKKMTAIEKAEK